MTTHRFFPLTTLGFALWFLLSVMLPGAAQTPTVTDLFTFATPNGSNPYSRLIQASDGNLYGTTKSGGIKGGYGTVFKITPAGALTTLYSFNGSSDGANPQAGLVQASDGNLYGTTYYGGASGNGSVFKITTSGTLTTLHSFSGNDGANPYASLIQASDGNLYGTTYHGGSSGGASNAGTIFKITPSGTLTTLYSFNGSSDGANPQAGLVQASDGNLYGTTTFEGYGFGTVFKITPSGTLTTLYSFNSSSDGASPNALIQASDGNLYGTTYQGGNDSGGTVFKITTSGTLTTLHTFVYTDGYKPLSGLLQASDGNLYGTTSQGGGNGDFGTVFKITTSGTLTTLHSFSYDDGNQPLAGLIQASDGNLYGTTGGGGGGSYGTVFKITPSGTLTSLYSFSGRNGLNPYAGLIQASDGNFYGTTEYGGYGFGTIFKITPSGTFTILYSFSALSHGYYGTNSDGVTPLARLLQATDGNLYGTATSGGANDTGTIFKITPSGAFTTLYSFSATASLPPFNNADGAYPDTGLIQASDGNLYGTTTRGGTAGAGTVFKITPSGTMTVLYSFSSYGDGSGPNGLTQASDGSLYSTTKNGGAYYAGTIFKITTSGALTTLYSFSGNDGSYPRPGLIQASDGNLYGTTFGGGASDVGTIFKMTPSGTLTTIYSFAGGNDGAFPYNGLIQASDGNLYGTTSGHIFDSNYYVNDGTVFKITPSGTLTTLHSFNYNDGAYPVAALVQASDGNLYGTSYGGGYGGFGVIFRVSTSSVPVLTSVSPSSCDAGGPAFTLTVKGSGFQSSSSVDWNGSPLNTTYVSATAIKAAVPASLIASPGKATITVVTGGETSNKKTFTILLTTLKLTAANLTKNSDGSYTANLTIKNVGYNTAPSVKVTKATLGAAATSTTLPVTVGNIAAGATANSSLAFPASAGTSGTVVSLKVSGTFTEGQFSSSLKVRLP